MKPDAIRTRLNLDKDTPLFLVETMTAFWFMITKLSGKSVQVITCEETKLTKLLKHYLGANYIKIFYSDIPGTYFESHKLLLAITEELFAHQLTSSYQVKRLTDYLEQPAAQALLLKSLAIRTFERTMKALVLFSEIAGDRGSALFLPRDARLIRAIQDCESGRELTANLCIPKLIQFAAFIKSFFAVIGFNLYLLFFIILNIAKRGIRFKSQPVFQPFAIRTYITEFLRVYDKYFLGLDVQALNEEFDGKLMVIFENGLTRKTEDDLNGWGIPYVDLTKERVPVRLLISMLAIWCRLSLDTLLLRWSHHPYLVHKAYIGALKDLFHAKIQMDRLNIKALVDQHDYPPDAIINTVITNQRGGKTFSFMHGTYWHAYLSCWHIYFDVYAMWGEYFERIHRTGWRFLNTKIATGACFQTKTLSFLDKSKKTDFLPASDRDRFLIVVYPTSYDKDSYSAPEHAIELYEALIELVKKNEDICVLIKVKNQSGDKATSALIKEIEELDRISIDAEHDSYFLLDLADLVIAHQGTSIGFESIAFGTKAVFYNLDDLDFSFFGESENLLVAANRKQLFDRIERIRHGEWLSPENQKWLESEFNDWRSGQWQQFIQSIKETAE